MVEPGDWGWCEVLEGRYVGEPMYYDDDDAGWAICYFVGHSGLPDIMRGFVRIRRAHLVRLVDARGLID